MFELIIICVALILLLLSLLHFYWTFGGNWGVEAAIPEKFKGIYYKESNQGLIKIVTLIMAIGLLAFAYIITENLNGHIYMAIPFIPTSLTSTLTITLGVLFIIRAIGDFNMFGIFKKESDSLFSKKDSQIFVPLCLFLGLSCLYIGYNS